MSTASYLVVGANARPEVSAMKATHPDPELPLVHMPFMSNAMPHRSPRTGVLRNLTGLYLGMEAAANNSQRSSNPSQQVVPPQSRGRGMPSLRVQTASETRRYLLNVLPDVTEAEIEAFLLERLDSVRSGQANTGQANTAPVPNADKSGCTACAWGPVNVPYMPAMPPSRFPVIGQQKLVELLREKEERKGFNPRPVTRNNKRSQNDDYEERKTSKKPAPPGQSAAFWDMTRQTHRNFTAANNSGVTHLEYLVPDASYEEAMAQKKAEEVEALQALLRLPGNDTMATPPPARYTGFSVKSYRNPNQAEIIANFPPLETRPRTTLVNNRHSQTSSYFFKTYMAAQTPGDCYSLVARSADPKSTRRYMVSGEGAKPAALVT